MSEKLRIKGGAARVPVMQGFVPLRALWANDDAPYPSEHAARWALRKLRDELAEAGAVALHRNRLMVHPERFAAVVERAALSAYVERAVKNG
ncbi:MAG: hypothetical protein N2055_04655 [Tepidimonas taiwanensis]|nr:hypothetical protein [Tepidimonas taiwanensis]